MSVEKNTYGIVGYDLTKYKDKILTEEFCDSSIYYDLLCEQRKEKIQFFDDPMSGNYLYFGYIFFKSNDSYEDTMDSISLTNINDIIPKVYERYSELKLDIIDSTVSPKIIVFHEYT